MASDNGGAEPLSAEEVELALQTLVVTFKEGRLSEAVWKIGCNTKLDAGPGWEAEHAAALVDALSALAVLGGLPLGHEPRHLEQWQTIISGLRVVRETLAQRAVLKDTNHACEPGYTPGSCCKKVSRTLLSRTLQPRRRRVRASARAATAGCHCCSSASASRCGIRVH